MCRKFLEIISKKTLYLIFIFIFISLPPKSDYQFVNKKLENKGKHPYIQSSKHTESYRESLLEMHTYEKLLHFNDSKCHCFRLSIHLIRMLFFFLLAASQQKSNYDQNIKRLSSMSGVTNVTYRLTLKKNILPFSIFICWGSPQLSVEYDLNRK